MKEMKSALDDYEAECEDAEFAQNTVDQYMRTARSVISAVEKCHESEDDEVKKADLIAWKRSIGSFAVSTQKIYITACNKFIRYVLTGDISSREKSPLLLKNVREQAATQTVNNIPTDSDLERLLRTARKKGYSDIAMAVEIIVGTGVRFGALKYFTVEALKGHTQLKVKSKSKYITVTLTDALKRKIRRYVKDKGITKGYLIPARTDTEKPMSKQTFWWRLQKVAGLAKVKKDRMHAHAFRHMFAKMLLDSNVPESTIADLLGHQSIETTKRYVRKSDSEMKEILNEVTKRRGKSNKGG